MYCTDFEFDGRKLSEFGYVMSALEGASNGTFPSGADIQFSQGTASNRDLFELYDAHYEEPYSISFTICKDPCQNATQEEMYLTPREVSFLQRWLCRRNKFCKFKVDQDEYRDIYWMGSFQSQQVTFCGRIIGLQLTLYTDSPYAYYEDVNIHVNLNNEKEFTLYSLSDEEGYVTPTISIAIHEPGDFQLSNLRDNTQTIIKNCTADEIIVMDGKHLLISSSNEDHNLGKDFNFIFPKLYNSVDNTENNFSVNIGCTIDMTYAPAVKVGL